MATVTEREEKLAPLSTTVMMQVRSAAAELAALIKRSQGNKDSETIRQVAEDYEFLGIFLRRLPSVFEADASGDEEAARGIWEERPISPAGTEFRRLTLPPANDTIKLEKVSATAISRIGKLAKQIFVSHGRMQETSSPEKISELECEVQDVRDELELLADRILTVIRTEAEGNPGRASHLLGPEVHFSS